MPSFEFKNGKVLADLGNGHKVHDQSKVFLLSQEIGFDGPYQISAIPAEVGLRLETDAHLAKLSLIGKPRGGTWQEINRDDTWVSGAGKLAYIRPELVSEILNRLGSSGVELGVQELKGLGAFAANLEASYFLDIVEGKLQTGERTESQEQLAKHELTVPLHNYQLASVEKLDNLCAAHIGGVLADEMGLGKTAQAIAVMVRVANRGGSSLVVVPSVLVPNWLREFKKFAPTLSVGALHRPSGLSLAVNDILNLDVVVTAYTAVAGSGGDLEILNLRDWDLVVIDEAQFIKNPESRRSVASKQIKRLSSLALSGTPVENSPLDLWSLAEFIFPGLLGDKVDFDTKLIATPEATERVSKLFLPLMIRRTLDDVDSELRLPGRVEEVEYLRMSPSLMSTQYEILHSETGTNKKFSDLVLAAAEGSYDLVSESSILEGSKFIRLRMIIENCIASGERLLVFTRFRSTSEVLQTSISRFFPDIFCGVINGDSGSPEERQEIVDRFGESYLAVLVLNPDAAGFGLNISSANVVVHYHPLWNPAKTDQATKRAHRPGQSRITKVYHFVYEDSVEELILERQLAKRELAESLLSSAESLPDDSSMSAMIKELKAKVEASD